MTKTRVNPYTGQKYALMDNEWKEIPSDASPPSWSENLGRNTVGSLFESAQNMVNLIPQTVGNIGNAVANPFIRAKNTIMTGNPAEMSADPRFLPNDRGPDLGLRSPPGAGQGLNPVPDLSLPTMDRNQLFGAAQMTGEAAAALTSGNFNQFTENPAATQQAISQMGRQNYPVGSAVGDLLGPALLITGAKSPTADSRMIADTIRQQSLEQMSRQPISQLGRKQLGAAGGRPGLMTSVLKSIEDSSVFGFFKNNFPRIQEAGLEGYILSTIEGGDPLEVAAMSAGAQGANRAFASILVDSAGKSPGLVKQGGRVAGTAFALTTIWEMAKIPFASSEEQGTYQIGETFMANLAKVLGAMGLAYATNLAGYGRVNTNSKTFLDAATSSAEAITSIPRNVVNGLINNATKDTDGLQDAIKSMSSDPFRYGNAAMRRFERAAKNNELDGWYDWLQEQPEFKERNQ